MTIAQGSVLPRRMGSFRWRRMGSVRLLLFGVLLSTLLAASLVTALTGFEVRSLPQAIGADLARSPRTSVSVYGEFDGSQARADDAVVRATLRRVFGPVALSTEHGLWSDSLAYATAGGAVTLVQAADLSHFTAHARLTAGSWPAAPLPGEPVQAAMPVGAASALHLRVGQVLDLPDQLTGSRVRIQLTGVYQPVDPTASYWGIDLIPLSGVSIQPGFVTYGPFVVAPGTFGAGGPAVGGATWLAAPDVRRISAGQLAPLARRVQTAMARLSGASSLGGLQLSSDLPGALSRSATKLVVARSLVVVSELELLLLVMATLAVAARMLAGQREEELAMLTARGSSRRQLLGLALTEALTVAVVAVVAGVVLGDRLTALLASTPGLRQAGLRLAPHGVTSAAWWSAGLVLPVCTAVIAWPALRPATPGTVRVRRGRRAAVSGAIRSGLDVALLLLALLAGWQLRHYSLLRRGTAGLGVDPVLALAPAIALAAATVLPLRLLPVAARAADWLAARTRGVGTALVSWEISRKATRQSAPMLLVVLAVGTGTLAIAQHASWHQSLADQSAFTVGADVRANLTQPLPLGRSAAFARADGVRTALPVSTGLTTQSGGQTLAIDTRDATSTVLLRPDQSALPPSTLWRRITPKAPGLASVALPGRPARLAMTASLARGSGPGLGPASVSLAIQDAAGVAYTVPAGWLPDDGREHRLVATLSPRGQAIYPLRLLAITVQYTMPVPTGTHRQQVLAASRQAASFSVSGLAVSAAASGPFPPSFDSGQALGGWSALASAPVLGTTRVAGIQPGVISTSPGQSRVVSFHPGSGAVEGLGTAPGRITAQLTLTAPRRVAVIPAVATSAFLRSNHVARGDRVQVSTLGTILTVKIAATVAEFPTIDSPQGAVIVNLGAAEDAVVAQQAAPLPVTQWWLSTAGGRLPRHAPPGATLTSRDQVLAALQSDPMAAIPQLAVLSIAIAAALLAVLGFSVSIAAAVRERRSQTALLSALGVDGRARARMLCLEGLAVSGPAAVTGLLLGGILAQLLVPAVTVTPTALTPVPPAVVVIPALPVAALAIAAVVVPVLVAAIAAAYRPDPAAQLRTAEAI